MLNTGTALEFNLLKVLYPFRREDVNIFLQKPIDRCPNANYPRYKFQLSGTYCISN